MNVIYPCLAFRSDMPSNRIESRHDTYNIPFPLSIEEKNWEKSKVFERVIAIGYCIPATRIFSSVNGPWTEVVTLLQLRCKQSRLWHAWLLRNTNPSRPCCKYNKHVKCACKWVKERGKWRVKKLTTRKPCRACPPSCTSLVILRCGGVSTCGISLPRVSNL